MNARACKWSPYPLHLFLWGMEGMYLLTSLRANRAGQAVVPVHWRCMASVTVIADCHMVDVRALHMLVFFPWRHVLTHKCQRIKQPQILNSFWEQKCSENHLHWQYIHYELGKQRSKRQLLKIWKLSVTLAEISLSHILFFTGKTAAWQFYTESKSLDTIINKSELK